MDKATCLIRTLLRCTVEPAGEGAADEARRIIQRASDHDWSRAIRELELHYVLPAVAWSVTAHELNAHVPKEIVHILHDQYRSTLVANMVRFDSLARVLTTLRAHEIDPTIWKGVLLADYFYPNPGMRPMGDVDVVLPTTLVHSMSMDAEHMDHVGQAFASAGFRQQPPLPNDPTDAKQFVDQIGVSFDVHHRVRMFEGHEHRNLTCHIVPQHIKVPRLRILSPNPMVLHLSVHSEGHRPVTGYNLRWILDFAFVMRVWGDRLDSHQIVSLAPCEESLVPIIRTAGFLRRELGMEMPAGLTTGFSDIEPYSLAEVLRSRRVSPWCLSSTRDWLRLLACGAKLWPVRDGFVLPRPADLLNLPLDAAREHSARRIALRMQESTSSAPMEHVARDNPESDN